MKLRVTGIGKFNRNLLPKEALEELGVKGGDYLFFTNSLETPYDLPFEEQITLAR